MHTQPCLHLARCSLLVAILDHVLDRRDHVGYEQEMPNGASQANPVEGAAGSAPVYPDTSQRGPDGGHVQAHHEPDAAVEDKGIPSGQHLVTYGPNFGLQEGIVEDEFGGRVDETTGAGREGDDAQQTNGVENETGCHVDGFSAGNNRVSGPSVISQEGRKKRKRKDD